MKKRTHTDVPQHLLPEYDDYVDDAVALANGMLSKSEEAAVRRRMAEDPIYKAVIDDILDAESAPPLPAAVVEASLKRFWEKAGMEPVVGHIPEERDTALDDFAERTRARQHVWRRRLVKIGAVAATIVALTVGSWFYFDTFWTEHRTPTYATMTLELPDGSTVTMAPDSKLRYLDDMRSGRGHLRRDLYLQGSAEFAVRTIGEVRFSVQTHNALVVVTGTRFHVDGRSGRTVVRVDEGRVSVTPMDEMGEKQGEAVTVDPGRTARVVGTRVMIDAATAEKRP